MAEEKPLYDGGILKVRIDSQETGGHILEIGDGRYFLESGALHELNSSNKGFEGKLNSINPNIISGAEREGIDIVDLGMALLQAELAGVERQKLSIRRSQEVKRGDYGPFGEHPHIKDGPQPHPYKRY